MLLVDPEKLEELLALIVRVADVDVAKLASFVTSRGDFGWSYNDTTMLNVVFSPLRQPTCTCTRPAGTQHTEGAVLWSRQDGSGIRTAIRPTSATFLFYNAHASDASFGDQKLKNPSHLRRTSKKSLPSEPWKPGCSRYACGRYRRSRPNAQHTLRPFTT
jgi:hypothetical protein